MLDLPTEWDPLLSKPISEDSTDYGNEISDSEKQKLKTLLDISYCLYEAKTYSDIGKTVFENLQKFKIDNTFGIKLSIYDLEKDEYNTVFNSGRKEKNEIPEMNAVINSPVKLKDVTNFSKYTIEQKKILIIDDNHSDFSLGIDERQKNIILHSMIFIPLFYQEILVGLISFARAPINSFDPSFIVFLESISKNISTKIRELLIENKWKNTEAELQQSYKLLETKVNKRTVDLEISNDALMKEISTRKQLEEKLETLLNIASELYTVKKYEDIGKIVFSHLQKLQWQNEFGAKLAIVDYELNLYKVVYILEGDKNRVPSDILCKINEVQYFSGYVLKTKKTLVIQNSHSELASSIDNRLLENPPGSIIYISL